MFVRAGNEVAVAMIQTDSALGQPWPDPPPFAVVEEIAAAQVACLGQPACGEPLPPPAGLR